ncbi:MAG: molybdopterin-binding/glycosyltransferase family 2 protein [Acetobacteraceae bacterium]
MIFGRVGIGAAEGTVLAHTQRLSGQVLKKGLVLDAAAVAALREAGVESVIAARLEAGDVAEDAAAGRLADALVTAGLTRTGAGTGRVNLAATKPGLLRVDAAVIDTVNAVEEALTVGTLPDYAVVAAREMVATIKVIPFAVPGAVLARAEAAARTGGLRLHPFRALRVGLVMTTLPGLKPSILAGTAEATEARVTGLTGTLLAPLECAHAEAPIAAAVRQLLEQGADIVLVAGASAVVDRRDVGPAGIVLAGGEILHFGMPVDPGNLICLGRIGDTPALVLPGCARSPKLNGIDWVLARLFAGVPVDGAAIARMGVGGLLKDVAARPLPRAKAPTAAQPKRRGIAAVVLAAGRSSRMAPHNKLLLADRSGKTMVARVVDNLLSSAARPVIVVTGHRGDEVARALAGRPVMVVEAADHAAGLSASLRAGIAAVPPEAAGAVVCLGDMPLVTGRMIDRLIEAYDPDEGRCIVAPVSGGTLGNPVLWDRRFFGEMAALSGDAGARKLLDLHGEHLATVDLGSDAVLRDFDTVESLATLPEALRPAVTDAVG